MPRPEAITLPVFDRPRVRIVVPVHGQLPYTLRCLDSLTTAAGRTAFRVVVVDDASSDGSADVLERIEHLRVLRLMDNVGYVHAVNVGAADADEPYVCLLNNDVEVTDGWLDAMVALLDDDPQVGLVGARLVELDDPDVLLEAGGAVFADAEAWNYGRGDAADADPYRHVREVDYCSAAAIVVRTSAWRELGGFDERYAPAYYEDVDLAFGVRSLGYQVMYTPAAVVRHAEGATHGRDPVDGVKAYQMRRNRRLLAAKWPSAIAAQAPGPERVLRARDRRPGPRVVIVDTKVPTPDVDAGSVRMWEIVESLRRQGAVVSLVATDTEPRNPWSGILRHNRVEVFDSYVHLGRMVEQLDPDVVVLSRLNVATSLLLDVRAHAPNALLVFDTVDLHHLRVSRQAELEGTTEAGRLARSFEELELAAVRACDVTLVVSTAEQQLLAQVTPHADVRVLATVHSAAPMGPAFAERNGVLFVGNHHHTPNTDAALHLANDVMPMVRRTLPGLRLTMVGGHPPQSVLDLADEHTMVPGWVPELTSLYDEARVAVAPLRYGAGVKGKVAEAMSRGIPTVLTPVAAEGMGLVDGRHALIAESAHDFALAVVRLHEDRGLWMRLAVSARDHVTSTLGTRQADDTLRALLELAAERRSSRGAA